jgi:hypothetical protein
VALIRPRGCHCLHGMRRIAANIAKLSVLLRKT